MPPLKELHTIFIASTPQNAAIAARGEADVIMVDLEAAGKLERQQALSAHFSQSSWDDVARIRDAVPNSEMMVRLDPWNPRTSPGQVERAIALGADRLMQPMIESVQDVEAFISAIDQRARFTPLIETIASLKNVDRIAALSNVDRIHIGLNDLHLQLGNRFLFEPLADGYVDSAAAMMRDTGLPFGFGGIGTLRGNPSVSPHLLLADHARLGSNWVILSRQFRDQVDTHAGPEEIASEIALLKDRYRTLQGRTAAQITADRAQLIAQIRTCAERH